MLSRVVGRRDFVKALMAVSAARTATAAPVVSTVIGNGSAGYSPQQVNNPYGLAIGPDRALYFCDLDNQRIRRIDLQSRDLRTIAGNGEKGYGGDGAAAPDARLNMSRLPASAIPQALGGIPHRYRIRHSAWRGNSWL